MRVLMVGRSRSMAFQDLQRYWGEVVFAKPPRIPLKRYDLVVAQEPTLRVGLPAYLCARATGAKLVVEVHGDYLGFLSKSQRALALRLIRKADYVRAVNRSIAESLRRVGARNILLIPSTYIDIRLFKPMRLHPQRPRSVMYAGRLTPEKNLHLLLSAFKRVLSEVEDATLTIVGDGPEKPSIAKAIKDLGLESSARMLPWVPRERLPELYNEAAVFALTSDYEGGPRALFEAGACCTPFVSTRVGIAVEVAEHGVHGFFADADPNEIAEYLTDLLLDPGLRQEMGDRLRRLVEERFEWSKAVERYAKAYQSLLE